MTQTDDVTRAHAAMQCPEDLATRSKHQKEKQVCVCVCVRVCVHLNVNLRLLPTSETLDSANWRTGTTKP